MVSDLHARADLYVQLSSVCDRERPQALIYAGDFLDASDSKDRLTPGEVGLIVSKFNCRINIFVEENHDWDGMHSLEEKLQFTSAEYMTLSGQAIGICNSTFAGFPCSLSPRDRFGVDGQPWTKNWLDQIAIKTKQTTWISHEAPISSLVSGQRGTCTEGSYELSEAIHRWQPDLVICGHEHYPQAQYDKIGRTQIINSGQPGDSLHYTRITSSPEGIQAKVISAGKL